MALNSSVRPIPKASTKPSPLRVLVERQRDELRALLDSPHSAGVQLARQHAARMDAILRTLFDGAENRGTPLLLGAVGGYGRNALGWKSDLDVCFVTNGTREELQPIVDELLYPLWDAGVHVGHQVIPLSEVVEAAVHDLPTATELLDFRPLAGSDAIARLLKDCLAVGVFAPEKLGKFIARLEEHMEARHKRFFDSVYLLEPDVKSGAGGLRDLDFALWAARARFGTASLHELAAHNVIPVHAAHEAEIAADFLWAVRNQLHELAGRRSDRLTFAEQEAVARALGYAATMNVPADASSLERNGAMVESFMSDYYRHARVITRVSEQLIGRAKRRNENPRAVAEQLGDGLIACEGGVAFADPTQLHSDPALALRIYMVALKRDQVVLARSRDAILEAASKPAFAEALRASPEANKLFRKLAASARKAPFRSGSALGELHEVGLLLAMIPEFAPVVGRVHHDIYHVYTVDVHSVAAVDRLHALARGELAAEFPLGCRLAAEIARPQMLAVATLLHDVGKAIGGHNHAERGAEMARPILTRLGFNADDVDDACHLILKHLALYVVAARRDLADPATIEEFSGEVRGREGLRDLYLLTVADLSTTSPKAMTKWKASMVDALWRATDARLSGVSGGPTRIARARAAVHEQWPSTLSAAAVEEYLDTMPERYLLSNTPSEIVAHAQVALQPRSVPVAAAVVPSSHEDVMELCVVTDGRPSTGLMVVAGDRPGLLASIAAAISANRLSIQAAQIHSRPLRCGGVQAVDLFWVNGAPEDEGSLQERLVKLERDLNAIVMGDVKARELLRPSQRPSRWSVRPLPPVQTEIYIEHHASSVHTIIEVITEDRPALLFDLAEALHTLGLTISVAKISTEGTRVIDVFYVSETDGRKVEPGQRTDVIRQVLLETLKLQRALS
ncbi:MAG TPA: [protein-PII] uridylyltransferase [Polyangiales bacterium]|nr:[protein-PII] uridylyltransferase [Polyangiales bacterium]